MCKVTAYIDVGKDTQRVENIEVTDLKAGMMVREIGALREVVGEPYDDDEETWIPLEDGIHVSPLLVCTETLEVFIVVDRATKGFNFDTQILKVFRDKQDAQRFIEEIAPEGAMSTYGGVSYAEGGVRHYVSIDAYEVK